MGPVIHEDRWVTYSGVAWPLLGICVSLLGLWPFRAMPQGVAREAVLVSGFSIITNPPPALSRFSNSKVGSQLRKNPA